MEEILPPTPVPPMQSPPPKRFPLKWILIILIIIVIFSAGILFAPIPYYQNEDLVCKIGQKCPNKGWRLGQSLGQKIFSKIQNKQIVTTEQSVNEPTISMETADWKTYTNEHEGFTLKYPPSFLVNDKAAKNTITIEKEYQSQKEAPGYPSFMYISLIPDDFKGKAGEIYVYDPEEARMLLNMQIGETDQDQRYTRLADLIIDGVNAKVFENLVPPRGSDKRRLYLHKGSNTYMIGLVISSEDKSMTLETFNQILSTFKFLETTPSPTSIEGQFCGGIANIQCSIGYTCKLDGSYPDAGGKCVLGAQ